MLKKVLLCTLAIIAVLFGTLYFAGESIIIWYMADELDEALPAYTLVALDGTPVELADLQGKVVVVDFWATWCAPCIQSFPYLQEVYDSYKDDDRVAFLVVNTGEDFATFSQFANKSEYTFPFVHDQEGAASAALITLGIPTLCIIEANGRLRYRKTGLAPNYVESLNGKIQYFLAN